MFRSDCHYRCSLLLVLFAGSWSAACAQSSSTQQPSGGQPARQGVIGGFEIIGDSLVSAQQLFLGGTNKVYFVDKVEGNPTTIKGHPAWASEWTLSNNAQRPMDAMTNTFCAGGNVLGNGTWINVGGNQAVTHGGEPAASQTGGGAYDDPDGRESIRLLDPCKGESCDWVVSPHKSDQRWYPTLETLSDGSVIILGGCRNGGYVNSANQDNPTYEFFPPKAGGLIHSPILASTLPANLFPLTWLLPSGKLLIQSNWATALLDLKTNTETPLDNVPDAVRVYPASAGTIMLPLTPENNYTATILFCGGMDVASDRWTQDSFIIPQVAASTSCVTLTPDVSRKYVKDDDLPIARSMANFIVLPDGKVLNVNGARLGTAGYGNETWAIGHSYADDAVLTPAIYNPSSPAGSRWSSVGLSASKVPRMYHSTALLLPDGSVMISGSNPNPDYTVGSGVKFPTEYRTELFYPSYYNERRPEPESLPTKLSYGGDPFKITLSSTDLSDSLERLNSTRVVLIRPGFSTHAMNMGQRYVELPISWTGYERNKTADVWVGQVPSPEVLVPGPALIFVVVKGVPSIGVEVMVGSGSIEKQVVGERSVLPEKRVVSIAEDAARLKEGGATILSLRIGAWAWIGHLIFIYFSFS